MNAGSEKALHDCNFWDISIAEDQTYSGRATVDLQGATEKTIGDDVLSRKQCSETLIFGTSRHGLPPRAMNISASFKVLKTICHQLLRNLMH
jgi:hypothetical protein